MMADEVPNAKMSSFKQVNEAENLKGNLTSPNTKAREVILKGMGQYS